MKHRLAAFLLCILLLSCTFAACKSADAEGQNTKTDSVSAGSITDITNVESSVSTPDEKEADIKSIEGFTPEVAVNGEVASTVFTDIPVMISAMGSYTGKYVEDGSDELVQSICAIVVKNISDKPIQYATVILTDAQEEEYSFVLSTLPAGCSVLVLETDKKVYSSELYKCTATADVTECEHLDTQKDKVKIAFDGERLYLENLTDTDFRAVYVRYKNYTAGNVYLGGITYNASFENVAAKSTCEYDSAHFYTGGSQVLMIQIVE